MTAFPLPFPLSAENYLSVDELFAEALLKGTASQDNFLAKTFLSFLLASARIGYRFIQISRDKLIPSSDEVWGLPIDPYLVEGANSLPREIFEEGNTKKAVIVENGKYYLHRFYKAEKICHREWQRLNDALPRLLIDEDSFQREKKELQIAGSLTDEQLLAVEMGCKFSAGLLTGGPGTGKTFTAAKILQTFFRSQLKNSPQDLRVAVTAPTGKAALALHASLYRVLNEHGLEHISLEPKTLHALLGLRSGSTRLEETPFLNYEVIFVDEASMIDVELMALLLSTIPSGSRVLLIGDPFQLPPVEGPPIFRDLEGPHRVSLTKCLRAESKDLIDFALHIREKNLILPSELSPHVKRLDKGNHPREILASYVDLFPRGMEKKSSLEDLFLSFQKFRILTPVRKGLFGVEQLNRHLIEIILKKGACAFPLLVTANDYELGLFNGDIGILLSESASYPFCFSPEDRIFFPGGKQIPALLMPSYELAYAMTIHKSQGSEFDEVLLFLPKEKEPYSKELIYTAVTRARKRLTLAS